ncbi:hypothetical protein ACFT9I_32965 [Streptomyces sp. NPDC057137]|uniref:hypothetical protein n=1 Tax=Streptomyces sp. NPDC057137 TaxID=3346030 RepID=UPI003645A31D
MTAVTVEITPRPTLTTAMRPSTPEPAGLVFVDDVESLTEESTPGCGNDNPYN